MQKKMLEKLHYNFPNRTVSIEQRWMIDKKDEYQHEWQLWIEKKTIEYFPKFELLWNRVNELCKDVEPLVKTTKTEYKFDPYAGTDLDKGISNYRGD